MNLYIDASVLVSLYVPEARSEAAEALFSGAPQATISRLSEVEFCSALAMKVRAREIPRRKAERVAQMFAKHVAAGVYGRLHLSNGVFDLAVRYLSGFNSALRTLEALHIACCAHHQLTLATADNAMARSAKALAIPCRLIRNEP